MKHPFIFKAWRLLLAATLIAGLAWTVWPASPAYAATITVNTTTDENNSDGDCSLREAIIAANTNAAVDACPAGSGVDTIDLPSGNYLLTIPGTSETAGFTGDLNINSDLTIDGAGLGSTTIDANGIDRVFRTDQASIAQISGVTIQGGNSGSNAGGNVLVTGTSVLTLTDSRVRNSADDAGIWVNSKLFLIRSRVHGNVGAGIVVNFVGTATILNSTISGNTYVGSGRGISNLLGTLTIVNSTISGNTADVDGGGIFSRGTTRLYNVTISNNTDTAT